MKPVRSIKNQYRGINAHLHSFWQARGGWSSFHTAHIVYLVNALKVQLLPIGYTAEIEPSLQIRRIGDPSESVSEYPEADVAIYGRDPAHSSTARRKLSLAEGVQLIEIPVLVGDPPLSEKQYQAVVIYQGRADRHGKPVAWLELLSPSNKGDSQDAATYRAKRQEIMRSGIVFVELDYLHETPSTFRGVARYYARKSRTPEPGSHPYRIIVADPRPTLDEGQAQVAQFDVDQAIPRVTIPLNDDDALPFDFFVPYTKTFEEALYGLELVDYSILPDNFDRYGPIDQTRIVSRMLAVLEAARRGENLEIGSPFPVAEVTLEEGLARVAALAGG
jgi:hypothetical protein